VSMAPFESPRTRREEKLTWRASSTVILPLGASTSLVSTSATSTSSTSTGASKSTVLILLLREEGRQRSDRGRSKAGRDGSWTYLF
jgi:hypothetical protein